MHLHLLPSDEDMIMFLIFCKLNTKIQSRAEGKDLCAVLTRKCVVEKK